MREETVRDLKEVVGGIIESLLYASIGFIVGVATVMAQTSAKEDIPLDPVVCECVCEEPS